MEGYGSRAPLTGLLKSLAFVERSCKHVKKLDAYCPVARWGLGFRGSG